MHFSQLISLLKSKYNSNKNSNNLWRFSDGTQGTGALEKLDMADSVCVSNIPDPHQPRKKSKGMSILTQQKEMMNLQVLVNLRYN